MPRLRFERAQADVLTGLQMGVSNNQGNPIMATIDDVNKRIADISASVDAVKASSDKAIEHLKTAVDTTAQAAALDAVVASLDGAVTKLGGIQTDITAAVAAVQPPAGPPTAPAS